jgi:hypothetical protein
MDDPPARPYGIPANTAEYLPSPDDAVDNWVQDCDSANSTTTRRIIEDLYGRRPSWIIDPFCGTGSTAVAARRLRTPFCGFDIDPLRACVTVAKACSGARHVIRTQGEFVTECLRLVCALRGEQWTSFAAKVRADLHTVPDPAYGTKVWCADACDPIAWTGAPKAVNGWVIYTSPPFAPSVTRVPTCPLLHARASVLMRNTGQGRRALAKPEPTYVELVTSMLRCASHRLGRGLAIMEYSPGEPCGLDGTEVACDIQRRAGACVSVQEVLTTGEFSNSGMFQLIVCEVL